MAAIKITKENFEQEVLKSDVPVLIDFWASWCGPCKMLSPTVEAVANETDRFKVGKINVDEEGELAMKYGVSAIPTLVVFKNGAEAGRSVGVIQKDQILALVGA